MDLSTAEQKLIEQRVINEAKTSGVAYILWLLGAHRFYIGRPGSGLAILALIVLGVTLTPSPVGSLFLVIGVIWVIIDLFLIPGMIQSQKDEVRENLCRQLSVSNQAAIDQHARLSGMRPEKAKRVRHDLGDGL
ncbi:TM2 domain-containing protein [Pararhizobium sp. BT-229]|uniref:TM2 domain-containing protein n=1 Tax=Pararhizobium sp. BT-229 TaxID=2986923 RepID=UPI0021F755A8|nr:TM2 domain-containing protein [Pararhizobium sp. BT-229]MCV9967037.1 TM2 domain-containing protein [Pararhizobium sp. BT-229]